VLSLLPSDPWQLFVAQPTEVKAFDRALSGVAESPLSGSDDELELQLTVSLPKRKFSEEKN